MNVSERLRLAMIAAELIYGRNTDHERSSIGYRLLAEFPSAKEDFPAAAEVEAEERIAFVLMSLATDRASNGLSTMAEASKRLCESLESIQDLVQDYCARRGFPATAMIDGGFDLRIMFHESIFVEMAHEAVKDNPALQPFIETFPESGKAAK